MKLTRRQLKQIISEALEADPTSEKEDIKITMDVPGKPETFTFSAVGDKVDAFFANEEDMGADPYTIQDTQEDKEKMLGALMLGLETATDEVKANLIIKAIARLFDELSEDEKDLYKVRSQIKTDSRMNTYAKHVRDPNTKLTY